MSSELITSKKNLPHVFLYDPKKTKISTKEGAIKLKRIFNMYDYDLDASDVEIRRIVKHLKKMLSTPATLLQSLSYNVRFRLEKNGEVYELPIIKFLYNLILISPIIDMGAKVSAKYIFDPIKMTDAEICKYMDEFVISRHRQEVSFYDMCDYLEFIKMNFNRVSAGMGERLMMSIDWTEFIELMKESNESRETLTCSFPVPADASPDKIEKISVERYESLAKHAIYREDLNISNYIGNGLFNKNQAKEFSVHITYKPDLKGNTIPMTSETNLVMGLNDPISYAVDSYGSRKAENLKLKVSDAGVLEKDLAQLLEDLHTVDLDYVCDSVNFRKKSIDSLESLLKVEGRIYTLDKKSDEFHIVRRFDTHLIGKTLYLKTPISCTHPEAGDGKICRACYSELLSVMNAELHIGKVTAFDTSNEFQQILLSAKHANTTVTKEIKFTEDFWTFFNLEYDQITFNERFMEAIAEKSHDIENYQMVFNIYNVQKNKVGEGSKKDRSVTEITIFDTYHDTQYSISEINGGKIYMAPALSEMYKKIAVSSLDDIISIPLLDFIAMDDGISLFEVDFKNTELAESLNKIRSIISTKAIAEYQTYDNLLDVLTPLFVKGGLKIQDIHIELIVSRLICDLNNKNRGIDWSIESPEYTFHRIESAILNKDSVIPSLMYSNAIDQLSGKYGTYEKHKPSIYDVFLADL